MSRIKLLEPQEARKIAAGEVIDRPSSLVREFLDNAIDSSAALIEVSIEDGGVRRVEVSDDGSGIEKDDLSLACRPHATSKIRTLEDLNVSRALGFRGEALAAAAAVCRLEILSSIDGEEGWRLETGPAGQNEPLIESARRTKGTTVRALGLFDTIPARKRFLKRPASEALLCKQVFIEKALAFPSISFRFVQDGALRLFLPAAPRFKQRFSGALLQNTSESAFLYEINAGGDGFSIIIVIGGPEIYRSHRREQFIFANGRRISDYSLLQAVEYGGQGAFPNGCHAVAAVFIDIEPHLADFNIHPAKREAKFANSHEIHHAISSKLRQFFHSLLVQKARANSTEPSESFFNEQSLEWSGAVQDASFDEDEGTHGNGAPKFDFNGDFKSHFSENESLISPNIFKATAAGSANDFRSAKDFVYFGTAFGLFLLVEWRGRLFAIDQHAACERVVYERLLSGHIVRQELLVPIQFITEDAREDDFLAAQRESFAKLGLSLQGGDGNWRIEALPALWKAGDGETVRAILDLKNAGENLAERWAATIACHSSIRDGDVLDGESAAELAREALSLDIHHCPHGRPFVVEISKESLLKAVRRL